MTRKPLHLLSTGIALAACTTEPAAHQPAPDPHQRVPDGRAEFPVRPGGIAIIRFFNGPANVDVSITEEHNVARALLDSLPLSVTIEDFGGREKIASLPRRLPVDDLRGSDPEDGNLIYYAPWGTLGLY